MGRLLLRRRMVCVRVVVGSYRRGEQVIIKRSRHPQGIYMVPRDVENKMRERGSCPRRRLRTTVEYWIFNSRGKVSAPRHRRRHLFAAQDCTPLSSTRSVGPDSKQCYPRRTWPFPSYYEIPRYRTPTASSRLRLEVGKLSLI